MTELKNKKEPKLNQKSLMIELKKKANSDNLIDIDTIEETFNELDLNNKLLHKKKKDPNAIPRPLNNWQKFSKVIRYDLSIKDTPIIGKDATIEIASIWKEHYKNDEGKIIQEKLEPILEKYIDYEEKGYFNKKNKKDILQFLDDTDDVDNDNDNKSEIKNDIEKPKKEPEKEKKSSKKKSSKKKNIKKDSEESELNSDDINSD
tara:strand:- start:115 stop:726 length:612 start_codon:yes stop_codon:yes gene_type:complete